MVVNLREGDLILKLNLMGDDIRANSGGPVSNQRIVARNPFGTDIGINLY